MAAILDEWFAGTLAAWTVSGADIVTADNDQKLRLNAAGEFAYRNFTAPATGRLIVEADLRYDASGTEGYLEVMDSGGPTARATVRFTGGSAYVRTDTAGEVGIAFPAAEYRQVILAFDQDAATVRFYLSQADGTYGTWDRIAEQGYSGGTINRVRFRTSTAGTVYADMVQVFVPGTFVTGDSISDGKPHWSEHPNYPGRLATTEDETNNPSYQLGLLTGEHVAARGFGGSTSTGVLAALQDIILDQYATAVVLNVGHNDLYAASGGLATLQGNIPSIFNALVAGGVAPDAITFCKVAPSAYFDGTPSDDEDNRIEYNRWLADFCAQSGCRIAFASEALNDNTKTTVYKRLNPAYDVGDGTHLDTAGDAVLAAEMQRARVPGGVLRRAGAGLAPAAYLTDSPGIAVLSGLTYEVRPSKCRVIDSAYAVRQAPSAKSLVETYRVALPHPAAMGLDYSLATAGTAIQKASQYKVEAKLSVSKSVTYSLAGGSASTVTMQRSCGYVVEVTTAIYYVAPSGGSDSNPGTIGSPWATIAHALATLVAGEKAYLRAGTFHELGLDFAHSGTYAANQLRYVTIAGYPGESVTIDGDYTGTGNSTQVFLTDSGQDYISIEDLEIVNSYYQAWYTGNSSPATRLRARNLHIHDVYGWVGDNAATIRWDLVTDGLIQNCELHDVWNEHLPSHPLSGYANTVMTFGAIRLEVTGCDIYNGDNLVFQKNADAGGGDGMIVHDNVLHDGNVGIRYGLQGSGSPPHHNQIAHRNVIYNIANDAIKTEVNYASAISQGLILCNNTIHGKYGITCDGFEGIEAWNNIWYDTGGSGHFRAQLRDMDVGFTDVNQITYWDYNLWCGTTGGNWTLQANGPHGTFNTTSFTTWQAQTAAGQPDLAVDLPDDNGLLTDPLFTDLASFDFTLQPTSPAIGAGRFGNDIGALPFVGVPPSTTIQKAGQYTTRAAPAPVQKAATCRVATTPVPIARGAAYEVVPPPGLIALAATYRVRARAAGTKAATYRVRTPGTPAARGLAYEIDPSVHVAAQRGLAYRVTAAPARALALAYALGGAAAGTVRAVAVPPEAHGAQVPPETHTVQVTG